MAPGTGVQETVSGEVSVAPGEGALTCGAACSPQLSAACTVKVRRSEASGSQPRSMRATTYQE